MARFSPARSAVIGEYAGEVLRVFPRGRVLVGLGGIDRVARERFADELAAAVDAAGVPASAVPLPDDVDADDFRRDVVTPFRRGPEERAVLVVSGTFAQRPDLVGFWHANAWLQVPRALARERAAAARGLAVDDPRIAAEFERIDRYFREVDARKRATATFDLTDPEHPRRVYEDAC